MFSFSSSSVRKHLIQAKDIQIHIIKAKGWDLTSKTKGALRLCFFVCLFVFCRLT